MLFALNFSAPQTIRRSMFTHLHANSEQSVRALFEEFMHPFADGSWVDPLRLATSQFAPNPTALGLFQDWGTLQGNATETLKTSVDHVLKCIEKGTSCGDPTFRYAFAQQSWILQELLKGDLLLANPIPGLRLSDKSEGPLPQSLHIAAFHYVLVPILDELNIKKLYFFGVEVARLYRLPNLVREHKPGIEVYVAAHPRSWSSPLVDRNPRPA
jgi:hypothetical protein